MDQERLEAIRAELSLGEVQYLHSTGSTNDDAHLWLMNDAPHLSVIVANEQTQGRGRLDHRWFTPPDSALALSIILTDKIQSKYLLRYSGLGSLAMYDAIFRQIDEKVQIKWPNDLLISGRKVGGVLPEVYWLGARIKGIVLGIGLNISEPSMPSEDLLSYPATYLELHTQHEVNRAEMCKAILKGVIEWNNRLGTRDFIKAWDDRLAYKGNTVQIILSNQKPRKGTLVGIANDGEILITFSDGSVGKYNSNELSLFPGA